MPTLVGVGISYNKKDSFQVGIEAATSATKNIKELDFVLVLSTEFFDQKKAIDGIKSVTSAKLAGCCTVGIIVNEEISREAIGVMAIKSDEIKF
jgi:hypothetical protein